MLRLGKLHRKQLEALVIDRVIRGVPVSERLVVKPGYGVDFAAIKLDDGRYLIVASDPVTGALERAGWYSVNVACNDVATSGNKPQFVQVVALLKEKSSEDELNELINDVTTAANELGVTVTGGHTEVAPGLDRTITVCTCFAIATSFVTSSGVRQGDYIVMTKFAGVEGTSILASAFRNMLKKKLGERLLADALNLRLMISVVKEAVLAYSTGWVNAMHDPTEGGLLGGLYEMSVASGVGFKVYEERVPVHPATKAISSVLDIDPLKLISSGVLLISVIPEGVGSVLERLRSQGVVAEVIGRFEEGDRVLVRRGGSLTRITEEPLDELWRLPV